VIEMDHGRQTNTLRVINRGEQPSTIQIRPFAWSQPGGEDHLEPTSDLLVSPPFATLNPGEAQTIRVVLRKAAAPGHEDSYRLLVDQLPPAAAAGSVRVALRISLPVFALTGAAVRPSLSWRLTGSDPHKRTLLVRNDGTRRARLSELKLAAPGLTLSATGFTFRYVLAGSEVSIPVEITAGDASAQNAARSVHVSAVSDQGKVDADAPIAPAA
jgi:fimbrial chaperone protein